MKLRLLSMLALTSVAIGCTPLGVPFPSLSDNRPLWQKPRFGPRAAPMAPTAGNLYRNSTGALSWDAQTAADRKALGQVQEVKEVYGESCQWSLNLQLFLLPIYVGLDDSGYQAAYLQALRNGGVDTLIDVRADRKVMGVLGIYWRVCTEVNATGLKLADGSPMKLGPTHP